MSEAPVRFKAGDAIPDWLLVREPQRRGAPRGNFCFGVDAQVLDAGDAYVVVPLGDGYSVFDMRDTEAHNIFAPSKKLRIVNAQSVWTPLDAAPERPPEGQAEPPCRPRRRSFGSRLWLAWNALFGE